MPPLSRTWTSEGDAGGRLRKRGRLVGVVCLLWQRPRVSLIEQFGTVFGNCMILKHSRRSVKESREADAGRVKTRNRA